MCAYYEDGPEGYKARQADEKKAAAETAASSVAEIEPQDEVSGDLEFAVWEFEKGIKDSLKFAEDCFRGKYEEPTAEPEAVAKPATEIEADRASASLISPNTAEAEVVLAPKAGEGSVEEPEHLATVVEEPDLVENSTKYEVDKALESLAKTQKLEDAAKEPSKRKRSLHRRTEATAVKSIDPVPLFPSDLKLLESWGVFRIEQTSKKDGTLLFDQVGSPVMSKVPYNPVTHYKGNPSHKGSGSSFEIACSALDSHDYKGLALGFFYEFGYAVTDLDHCRDAITGKIDLWAIKIVNLINSYTEISVSGTGLHIVSKGWQVPWDGTPEGRQGRRCGIEMYSGKHYFTVSGKHLTGTPTTIESRDLSDLYRRLEAREFAKPGDKTLSESAASSSSTETPASTSAQVENTGPSLFLTTKMELLMHGVITPGSKPFVISTDHNSVTYSSQSEADQALCNLLAIEGFDAEQIAFDNLIWPTFDTFIWPTLG